MAFQTPITIKEAIENIHSRRYFLPAIQREFVWNTDRIEKLFDSVLQGYPINSFLFWEVKEERKTDYQFYEFIKDYKQDIGEHNAKANVDMVRGNFTAILDGQQRLTSFYIGLMGSYSERYYRTKRGIPSNYYTQYLYINLLNYSEDEGKKFSFEFMEPKDAVRTDQHFWYKVSDILLVKEPTEIFEFIYGNELNATKEPLTILTKLHTAITSTPIINFFLEKSDSLDKVLNVFIRINSGGMSLSYSDMLFSMAAAQWKTIDARKEIHELYDKLRQLGFWGISKDWILKACLYLTNISDIKFKVDNFNDANMRMIEKEWEKIKNTLLRTVELSKKFGYDSNNIVSYNAFLPIAHYLHNYNDDIAFATSSHFRNKRIEIIKWLNVVTLKRSFGGNSDAVLSAFRKALIEKKDFDFLTLKESVSKTSKNISFSEDELEILLETNYGDRFAYPLLSIIYGNPDFDVKPHLDHINPGNTVEFKYPYNTVINLQLLQGQENIEKQDEPFNDWFFKNFKLHAQQIDFRTRHFLPSCDLSPNNFDEFASLRKDLLKNQLKLILQ